MDNRKIYQSKEFSIAWDKHQREKEDVLRTRLMNKILLKELNYLKGKIVLDAGCGNGFFIKSLQNLKPKKLFAFDISETLNGIVKKENLDMEIKTADLLEKLPYKNNQFDVTVCYNVLMDLPKIENAIKELARITKKELHIVIVHPLYNLFFNDKKAQEETTTQRLQRYTKEEHLEVSTIPGYENFIVYRRPISDYVNSFMKSNLIIEKMLEVPINEEVSKVVMKYKERIGVPVFIYFKLRKYNHL